MNKEKKISVWSAATMQDHKVVHEIFSELRKDDTVAW